MAEESQTPVEAEASSGEESAAAPVFNANEQAAKAAAAIKKVFLGIVGLVALAVLVFVGGRLLSGVGKVAWLQSELGGDGSGRLLSATDSVVIGIFAGKLAAVHAADGRLAWSVDIGGGDAGVAVERAGRHYVVAASDAIRCISESGQEKWKVEGDGMELVGSSASVVAVRTAITKERALTAEETAAIEKHTSDMSKEEKERFMLGQRQMGLGLDRRSVLQVFAAADGKKLWEASVPGDRQLAGVAVDAQHVYMLTTKWTDDGAKAWLVAAKAESRKLAWKQSLGYAPDFGPVLSGDLVLIGRDDDGETAATYRAADGTPSASVAYDPYAEVRAAFDDGLKPSILLAADSVRGSLDGKEQWALAYSGGVIGLGATADVVVAVGRPEGTLSNAEFGMATQMMGIDDGALKSMMAQSVGNEKTLMQGINRRNGDQLWTDEELSGVLVSQGGRIVLLQDTAKTSRMTQSSGKLGELIVRQLDPKTGKSLGKHSHADIAIGESKVIGDRLIGIAFERGESGKCLGLIALKLK